MPICFFIRYKNLMQICSVKGIYLHVCMHVCMYVYLLFNILLSKSLNHYSFGYIYMMSEFIIHEMPERQGPCPIFCQLRLS